MQVPKRRAIEKAIANTVKFRRFWRTKVKPKEVDLNTWFCGATACLGGWAARFFHKPPHAMLGTSYTNVWLFLFRCRNVMKNRLAQGRADWREGDDRLTEHIRQLRRLLKP